MPSQALLLPYKAERGNSPQNFQEVRLERVSRGSSPGSYNRGFNSLPSTTWNPKSCTICSWTGWKTEVALNISKAYDRVKVTAPFPLQVDPITVLTVKSQSGSTRPLQTRHMSPMAFLRRCFCSKSTSMKFLYSSRISWSWMASALP